MLQKYYVYDNLMKMYQGEGVWVKDISRAREYDRKNDAHEIAEGLILIYGRDVEVITK